MAAGLKVGDVLFDRYPIEGILGEGGMGAVYKAADLGSSRHWAIKEMNDRFDNDQERQEAREAFAVEANILCQLEHPNLPRVTHYFEDRGRQYLVMDLVEGHTLEAVLKERQYLPVDEALTLAVQLGEVLKYLHGQPQPIIFRDLKPANIMFTKNGSIKLIDFGIARFFQKGKAQDTRALGTPGYAAPEQYGQGQSDARTDIYALGATLHQTLSGTEPSVQPFHFASIRQSRPDVPEALDAIIAKAVAIEPAQRFADIKEFLAALEALKTVPEVYEVLPQQLRSGVLPPPPQKSLSQDSLDFGLRDQGSRGHGTIILQGRVKGSVTTLDRWLSVSPGYVDGTDVPLDIIANTSGLTEGAHKGTVRFGNERLVVGVEINPVLGCWTQGFLALLTIAGMMPFFGALPIVVMVGMGFMVPRKFRFLTFGLAVISAIMCCISSYVTTITIGNMIRVY